MPKKKKFRLPPPVVPIPVYRIPSEDEYKEFLEDPDSYDTMDGTRSFYSSLRFPDNETDIELEVGDGLD